MQAADQSRLRAVQIELFLVASALNSDIAASARQCEVHGFIEELEALKFLDRLESRVLGVEHDKSLTLGLQVLLCNDINDISILGEERLEHLLERLWFDALFEVAHVDSVGSMWSAEFVFLRVT